MISLFLVAPRIFRPLAWTWTARPLCALGRAAYSTSKHDTPTVLTREEALALKEVDSRAYHRYRYATDKNFRERIQRNNRKFRRKPENKNMRIIHDYEYNRKIPGILEGKRSANLKDYREKLEIRRSRLLASHILKNLRWIKEGWTWKLHEPVITPDRVDHDCTACQRSRYLRLWWREKSNQSRYTCSTCFANKFDLVVPESEQDKELPRLLTDPTHPPPPPPPPPPKD